MGGGGGGGDKKEKKGPLNDLPKLFSKKSADSFQLPHSLRILDCLLLAAWAKKRCSGLYAAASIWIASAGDRLDIGTARKTQRNREMGSRLAAFYGRLLHGY